MRVGRTVGRTKSGHFSTDSGRYNAQSGGVSDGFGPIRRGLRHGNGGLHLYIIDYITAHCNGKRAFHPSKKVCERHLRGYLPLRDGFFESESDGTCKFSVGAVAGGKFPPPTKPMPLFVSDIQFRSRRISRLCSLIVSTCFSTILRSRATVAPPSSDMLSATECRVSFLGVSATSAPFSSRSMGPRPVKSQSAFIDSHFENTTSKSIVFRAFQFDNVDLLIPNLFANSVSDDIFSASLILCITAILSIMFSKCENTCPKYLFVHIL